MAWPPGKEAVIDTFKEEDSAAKHYRVTAEAADVCTASSLAQAGLGVRKEVDAAY